MAAKQSETPWDDFLSDFTLVLDSGQRIRCHKKALANASPVLKMMLMTNMKEANTNEMNMKGYALETIIGFLRYIYAEPYYIEQLTMENQDGEPSLKSLVVEQGFRVVNFDDSSLKIYTQLIRLAHMYQVEDLVRICVDNLKEFKPYESDALTAKDIHKLAVELDNKDLKQCSSVWLASDAFQTLRCGAFECEKKDDTKKPEVLLKCKDCGRLTHVSSHEPNVLDEDGELIWPGDPLEDSKVTVDLP